MMDHQRKLATALKYLYNKCKCILVVNIWYLSLPDSDIKEIIKAGQSIEPETVIICRECAK